MRVGFASIVALALMFCAAANAAEIRVEPYGVTKGGQAVTSYTLVNDKGASATILDFGGAIAAIRVPDREGKLANVVMAFNDIAAWETFGHANSIIGRVANRITNGFTLDGVRYTLPMNAQGVTMHSGPPPYTTRVWKAAKVRKNGRSVTLTLDSPDGDQGFPGRVKIKAVYTFGNDNALRMDLSATTDKTTYINLTNHVYFNLNGSAGIPVWDHVLQMAADKIAYFELGKGITGEIRPVAGTPADFTRPTLIRERLALSLDAAYGNATTAPPVPAGMIRSFNESLVLNDAVRKLDKAAARLTDPASGRVLEMRTNEVSIQVYTPATIRDGLLSDLGKPFPRAPSIALEAEHLPDSPNFPQFPSIKLRPGEKFRSSTIYAFTTDAKK